jgi:hypothetical protein
MQRLSGATPSCELRAGKAWYDLTVCLKLGREKWVENKAPCSWCRGGNANQRNPRPWPCRPPFAPAAHC